MGELTNRALLNLCLNATMSNLNIKSFIKPTVGVVIAVTLLVLIFDQVNLKEVLEVSAGISLRWLFVALIFFGLDISLRIFRWKIMLQVYNPLILWRDCAGPLLAGFAINNLLPLRMGDITRTFAFNKKLRVESGGVFATLILERLFDLIMVLFILILGLYFFQMYELRLFGVVVIALLFVIVVSVLILNFPRLFIPIGIYVCKLISKLSPRISGELTLFINNIIIVLDLLSGANIMMKLTICSFFIWIAEGCFFWIIALGLPAISNASVAWLALPVGALATIIPSAPGYVGTFDYFVIQTMQAFGNDNTSSTAFTLIIHALMWFLLTTSGVIYILINSISFKGIKVGNNE